MSQKEHQAPSEETIIFAAKAKTNDIDSSHMDIDINESISWIQTETASRNGGEEKEERGEEDY
ncbi:hypothetical protein NECAME_13776 [Necator americanus]|uniref:Uncharacterized protein n=1 Tax=Necator americanus TaxID=51031 RepID=W2ST50_NECAM|nr:hypothetical protein NECAME_13776 [Necator americanus]ETN72693.1 hypothetical protein NECAME_13776 [Necator americanus]